VTSTGSDPLQECSIRSTPTIRTRPGTISTPYIRRLWYTCVHAMHLAHLHE